MSGVAVIMGIGLWYTEPVALYLFRQPDKVARVRNAEPPSSPAATACCRVHHCCTPEQMVTGP